MDDFHLLAPPIGERAALGVIWAVHALLQEGRTEGEFLVKRPAPTSSRVSYVGKSPLRHAPGPRFAELVPGRPRTPTRSSSTARSEFRSRTCSAVPTRR
jgi:hypothetical protein